mgnify:CR=1 FL=1
MDFITNIVAKFFGNKSEKDIEEIKPIVEQTNAVYATLSSLSNDQLRAKSDELRLKIHANYADEQKEIDDLKSQQDIDLAEANQQLAEEKAQRNLSFLIAAIAIAILIAVIAPVKNGSEFLFLFAPFSIIMANYIEVISERWFKEVFIVLLLITPIIGLLL